MGQGKSKIRKKIPDKNNLNKGINCQDWERKGGKTSYIKKRVKNEITFLAPEFKEWGSSNHGKPWNRTTHPPLCALESAGSWLRNSIPSRPQCCQRSLSQASAHQTSLLHKYASGCHKRTALCSHPTVLQTSHLTLQEKNREVSKKTLKKENQSPKHSILKEELSGHLL